MNRIIATLLLLVAGCGPAATGNETDAGPMLDMANRPSADLSKAVDGAPTVRCSWMLTSPAESGDVAVSAELVNDGRTQCVVSSDAVELRVMRPDGKTDDFIIATNDPAKMHLYRLLLPGQPIPEITCQTWSGNIALTSPQPMPSAIFSLTCTDPNGGYTYWDMGVPATNIAGEISVGY